MKRIGHLFEKIVTFENLMRAAKRAARGKKAKNSVARYVIDMEKEAIKLQEEFVTETYQPMPYNQFMIYEPKERNICSSDFRDRVAHHAICGIIEPVFERRLIKDSYACRVGKGTHAAIKRCQEFSRQHRYFLKCDISKYFESIDHDLLKNLLSRIFKDEKLLRLLDRIIDHSVPGSTLGKGVPIGNLTSQHFANLYLGELDHFIKETLRVPGYVRYMDDFILFHDSKEFLKDTHQKIEAFISHELALKLKEKATILAPVSQGIPFLGFRVFRGLIRVQRKNLVRLRRSIKRREAQFIEGKISEEKLVLSMNSLIEHISQADSTSLLRKEVLRSLRMA